jgi:hypothetical protein
MWCVSVFESLSVIKFSTIQYKRRVETREMRRQFSCEGAAFTCGAEGEGAYFSVIFPAKIDIPCQSSAHCFPHSKQEVYSVQISFSSKKSEHHLSQPSKRYLISYLLSLYIWLYILLSYLTFLFIFPACRDHFDTYVGVKSRSWIENCLNSSKNIVDSNTSSTSLFSLIP